MLMWRSWLSVVVNSNVWSLPCSLIDMSWGIVSRDSIDIFFFRFWLLAVGGGKRIRSSMR